MKIRLTLVLLLAVMGLKAQRTQFVNLTAEEVGLTDGGVPRLAWSFPLPADYQDSLYTVSLLYPEFIDAPQTVDSLLPPMPQVEQRVALDRKRGALEVLFTPWVWRDGRQQILVSFMMRVTAVPRPSHEGCGRNDASPGARVKANVFREQGSGEVEGSLLASGRWAKIRVPATGVYEITDALVRQAGFSDASKVRVYGYGGALQPEMLSRSYLAATDDLQEVPTATVNGRRLFYAVGPVSWSTVDAQRRTRNHYSDYGYYFLTQGDEEPLKVSDSEFLGSFYPSPDDYHSLYEVDGYAWYPGGRNLYDREQITTQKAKQVVLRNEGHAATGTLSVRLSGGTTSGGQILLNDSLLGTFSFTVNDEYTKGVESTGIYSIKGLKDENTVSIVCTRGGPLRLDYVSMAWDTPRPAPDLQGGTFPAPEFVYNITNQNLHGDPQADMVIIIPTSQKLRAEAERLKAFHEQHDSLRVNIVPADELYNEFSSGTPDANAYRRYMKMLYDRAGSDADLPRYLLLFGDCMWDNRLLTAECAKLDADDLLLCFESENSLHKVNCYIDDGFFGLLDEGEGGNPQSADKLDIAIGRFPVNSVEEAKIMVDKTIAYAENENAGAWQNTLVFMGDDGDDNRHMRDLNEAAEEIMTLHPGYTVKKIIWDAYDRESSSTGYRYPEVTRLIKQAQQQGALIMDYAGHGSEVQVSHESVLRINDFAAFTNRNLPLWITASCDLMPFDGISETIGETAVLNPRGGAVAFFGTTRTVYATQNKVINMAFLRHVLSKVDGKPITIGEAQRRAKNELIEKGTDLSTNKLQYSLLGDPALALHQPQMEVIVDSINGQAVADIADNLPQMKAGSIANVAGHIDGAEDFNGVVALAVRDSRELITCKLNNTHEADVPFTYYDRTNTLFQGTDSVRGGKFRFNFAIPKDLNYSGGTGLINLHAYNSSHTLDAHGYSEDFRVGGSDLQSGDPTGPSIYCYLNAPSFNNGDRVNSTPYFVAQLSDSDGINASGSGIGHDLELVIDGEMSRTYVLNDNFQFDFGSYTSGTTYYSIPELTEGEHTLLFRAWDIMNNSSVATLNFRVAKNLEPVIYDISCTNNPARTQTTFIVSHDRTGSAVDIEIEVFDMSGRQLWSHLDDGITTSGAYTYDWNLCVDGGQQLQTGIYLYRMRLTSEGTTHTSKARKLIVINN